MRQNIVGERRRISRDSFFPTIERFFSLDGTKGVKAICKVVKDRLSGENVWWCNRRFQFSRHQEALHQMQLLKAHGPEGLPTMFYQKFWHILSRYVKKFALDVLNNGKCPENLNRNFIFLISKGKNPHSPKDFRPISLCNITMKIITKFIANRLKHLLPGSIDEK